MAMRSIAPDLRMPQAMRGIAGEFRREWLLNSCPALAIPAHFDSGNR
jgi:hypothetical protein